ncbi:MAG: hypothetical protein IPM24_07645 [Bryobacterales bacterium]|jgi:hypothetical protein|nr:hypothetical protein [Bryobacterales bacterium]
MFPNVDGFHWTFGHILFLSIFFAVLLTVGFTAATALARMMRNLRPKKVAEIRWHTEFEDLPASDRQCRHALTGAAPGRVCENGFECRHCADYPKFSGTAPEPQGRLYHRGHTWVERQPDGTFLVGLDELGEKLIGAGAQVELPAPGTRLASHDVAWRMGKPGNTVRLLAPVEGEVVETGSREKGWYLRVKPESPWPDLRHLLGGAAAAVWLDREMERVQALLAPAGMQPTLADGGVLVDDLPKAQPEADWHAIHGAMFLEP